MKKYLLILISCLFLSSSAFAKDVENTNPDLFGIELGSTVKEAEKACKKAKGVWYASRVNLFSCRGHGFSVSVEANGRDVLYNIHATFKQPSFYLQELKSFISSFENVRVSRTGANSTIINDFSTKEWVANFVSFGGNGNYTAHLYNVKGMMSK